MEEYELIIIKGDGKGSRYPLGDERVHMGRNADNDVIVEDEMVSRKHCCIWKQGGRGYRIKDLDSTNKTIVNNADIQEKDLAVGDRIRIGDTVFLFTTVKEGKKLPDQDHIRSRTRVITVTEMKIVPDENAFLDIGAAGNNLNALRRAHRDLATLYKLWTMIISIQDTGKLLEVLAEQMVKVLHPDRVVIMLFDDKRSKIINRIVRTGRPGIVKTDDISMTMVYDSLNEKMAILSYDALADERFRDKQSVILNRIRSAMCTPIKSRETVLGVIYLDTSVGVGKFEEQDLKLLSVIGNQAGVAIQNAHLYEDLEDLFTGSLKTLVAVIEAKDKVTSGHSVRVTVFSLAIARELNLDKEWMRNLKISALLHDIGKVGVPESILSKPAPLDEDEVARMRKHPVRGAEIIKNIKNVEEVVTAVRHHHEYYNGRGIPDGLKGDKIPLISRILAVADAFDAITFDRPYRKGISADKAVKEIQHCSGSQFDPKVVDAFARAYYKGVLNEIPEEIG